MYTGNYYLIFTYKKSATSKEKRIGKDDYIIFRNEQKILLDGYDENKLLTEQNQEILDIINRFK